MGETKRQVWHTIVALEPDDVEMVRSVGLAPAGLFVESCENCMVWGTEGGINNDLTLCAHHEEMDNGFNPKWHLVGSRVVEIGGGDD